MAKTPGHTALLIPSLNCHFTNVGFCPLLALTLCRRKGFYKKRGQHHFFGGKWATSRHPQ